MTEIINLIEPNTFTVELAILIFGFMTLFAYIMIRMRHAILGLAWFIMVAIIGMFILTDLSFIWFWIIVLVQAAIVSLAAVFRFFVIPSYR